MRNHFFTKFNELFVEQSVLCKIHLFNDKSEVFYSQWATPALWLNVVNRHVLSCQFFSSQTASTFLFQAQTPKFYFRNVDFIFLSLPFGKLLERMSLTIYHSCSSSCLSV